MNRRLVLATIGGLFGLSTAGCVNFLSDSSVSGHIRPDDDPATVRPPLECEEDNFARHTKLYESVSWGDVEEFSLRVSSLSFEYGDTADITLKNTSSSNADTGTKDQYHIETYTEEGWREVRGNPAGGSTDYTDLGVTLGAGETFEWSLELTEEGLGTESGLVTCPDLQPGRYRFVFFGTVPAVAVAFDLTE